MICRYLPYTITLKAPAILTTIGGDPNSSRTLPFIPGSAVRGAVARALGDPGNDPVKLGIFQKLILGQGARYLNAYPRVDGHRSVPMPVSFRMEKGSQEEDTCQAFDLCAYDREEWPEESLVPVPEPFVTLGAARPKRVSAGCGSRIHHQRDRAKGRAWVDPQTGEARGTIFTFEYLEAGQEFQGMVQVFGEDESKCEARAEHIKKLLGGSLLIGRSRRGGYGGYALIKWGNPCERELRGPLVVQADIDKGAEFRVLLLSDYIGRNAETGELDPAYLVGELIQRLDNRVEVTGQYWKFGIRGSFNRKWRLEVQQAPVCAAGSVLVLKATKDIPYDDIKLLEDQGLGERRAEGFGRVAFLKAASKRVTLSRPSLEALSQPAKGEPPDLVVFVEQQILLQEISRVVLEEAARLAKSATSPPSASLIGRLRNALRAEPSRGLSTLREWLGLEGDKGKHLRQPAMEQLDRCSIGNEQKKLSHWLRDLVRNHEKSEDLSEKLHWDVLVQRYYLVSEEAARQCLERFEDELRVRFIDATLAALARRKRGGVS